MADAMSEALDALTSLTAKDRRCRLAAGSGPVVALYEAYRYHGALQRAKNEARKRTAKVVPG